MNSNISVAIVTKVSKEQELQKSVEILYRDEKQILIECLIC